MSCCCGLEVATDGLEVVAVEDMGQPSTVKDIGQPGAVVFIGVDGPEH